MAIVAGRYHESLTEKLVEGALACLDKHGVADADVSVVWVPGAFELAIGAQMLLWERGYDPGPIDGIVLPETIAAAGAFTEARGLVPMEVGIELVILLAQDAPRREEDPPPPDP